MAENDNKTTHVHRMKFAEEYVDPILNGEKTLTIRLQSEWASATDLDSLKFLTPDGEVFAEGFVHRARKRTASDAFGLTRVHSGHRSYDSREEFYELLESYYPDAEIGPETEVRTILFRVKSP